MPLGKIINVQPLLSAAKSRDSEGRGVSEVLRLAALRHVWLNAFSFCNDRTGFTTRSGTKQDQSFELDDKAKEPVM